METARQHWEILRRVPDKLARKFQTFMVIGDKGEGVLLATEDGDGYWLGEIKFGEESKQTSELIEPLDVPNVASMAHGYSYILLLSECGQIYVMGENNQGQLGLGTVDQEICFVPQLISSPHKFISVRCGKSHSLSLTEDGKVWAWGWNGYGQVGVSWLTANPHPSPRNIHELDRHRVVAVECGGDFSLALTNHGEVYAWGANVWGQFGDGSESSKHTPTRIPTSSLIESMAAGFNHSLLLTRTGQVYACGRNEFGQLGLPTATRSSSRLVKVAGLPLIVQIASHFQTNLSIAMSTKRECFVWGCLDNSFTSIPIQLPPIYSTLDSVLSFQSSLRNTPCSVRVKDLQFSQQTESLTEPIILVNRIVRMFNNPDSNPDVRFELEDQTILAHRSVLQISSAHFNRLFSESSNSADINPPVLISQSSHNITRHTANSSETVSNIIPIFPLITIPISDYSYPTFHAYIQYLYTGTFQIATANLTEFFDLARFYLESDLEQLCLARMRSTVSLENCCLYYQLTDRHSLPEFQQELVQFIADNIFQVFLTDAYKSLNGDLCQKLTIFVGNLRR